MTRIGRYLHTCTLDFRNILNFLHADMTYIVLIKRTVIFLQSGRKVKTTLQYKMEWHIQNNTTEQRLFLQFQMELCPPKFT